MKNRTYQTITGRTLDLGGLGEKERTFLAAVQRRYGKEPEWSAFAAWWTEEFRRSGLTVESVAYRTCQDLEARLGIAQGKVGPPDYRDYLADLIEESFGSRYRFCKEKGVDPGHLSRVLAGRSELSLQSLQHILQALHAALVIQPEEDLIDRVGSERGAEALARELDASEGGARMSPEASPDLSKLEPIMREVKRLAAKYYELTGRPLGVTGEVAEFEAARLLGLELAPARHPGADASRKDEEGDVCHFQIKGRCLQAHKKSGKTPSISLSKPWDAALLVLLDEHLEPTAIYRASRSSIEEVLKRSGSQGRDRGQLGVSQFKGIGKRVWSRPLDPVKGSAGPLAGLRRPLGRVWREG